MSKIKLTKNELRKQKDALKRFRRYLPTLQLKKQQLQLEVMKINKQLNEYDEKITSKKKAISQWVAVFSEDVKLEKLIEVTNINIYSGNIAGVDIPILDKIEFQKEEYDYIKMPIWIDYGIEAVEEMIELDVARDVLQKQIDALKDELRITTQRVNLFEKVKIPEAQENIRIIQIYLGDMQTASVVIGKIAKGKIQKKAEMAVLV